MSFQGKMYFVSEDGKVSQHYNVIEPYRNGFAAVSNGEGWGYIDENFTEICELKYESMLPFNGGYSAVRDFSRKWGFINEQGEEICELKYDDIWDFSPEGVALVSIVCTSGRKYGFINQKGEEVCVPKYDFISSRESSIKTTPYGNAMYYSTDPEWRSEFKPYSDWWDKELAIIFLDNKMGIINTHGKIIAEPKHDDIRFPLETNEQYIPVCIDGKWGFVDRDGNEVTEICYDDLSYRTLTGGTLASVNKMYGFIDEDGNELCPFKYDYALYFHNGYAAVQVGKKWGFINTRGEEICEPKYDKVGYFEASGYAFVANMWLFGWKTGYINGRGEFFKKLPKEVR